uniref:polynucleotide adenylyltransferase n=1 Tax=Meloidogyne javanica TaxID=6303 RepID=A0A915LBI9_MELJA
MTDWKSLIVLEYIIYMELTRNELSKLQVEEDEEEEKIKIVDHMHTTANTFKINFWKARNFKGEINDLEIEYYNNEDNKEFNEKERTLMHLNKINELLNNEEFKQFLQYEASVAYGAVQTVTPKKPTKGPKKGYISSVDRKGITIEEVTKKEKKKKSKQLYQLIANEYCIHENIIQARNGVLNVLGQVIKQWIENVKENKGLSTNSEEEEEEFQLLKGGSDILGTTAHWSDMDILCILPKYINIYDFIEEDASGLYGSLMTIMSSDNINVVKTSRILMLEFTMFEIDVDLIYAQIPFEKIETDFDIMDDEIIEGNKNARSILALADRLIYSNIAGYLSGHSLSIMSAKICIENPEATSLSFVIKQFFNVYKAWNWGEEPLFLVDLVDTNEEFGNASEIVEPWRWVKNENFDSSSGSMLGDIIFISSISNHTVVPHV